MKRRIERQSEQIIKKIYGLNYHEAKESVNLSNVNLPDKDGRTLVIHSVLAKNLNFLKWIINQGADVNKADNLGWTALHHSAQQYLPEIAFELILNGADVNARDEYGNNVLWRAVFASKGRGDIINLLLANGADRDANNNHGVSPLKLANTIANFDVKKFF